jgi:hypothetical protein
VAVVNTYSSQQVVVSVTGVPMTGVADGDFCKITRDEDAFHKVIGADGLASRSRNANQGGTITVILQSTSPSNAVLSALATTDELFATGVGTVVVKDLSGSTVCVAQNGWVKKKPEITLAQEQNNREWVIDCDRLTMNVGGNPI